MKKQNDKLKRVLFITRVSLLSTLAALAFTWLFVWQARPVLGPRPVPTVLVATPTTPTVPAEDPDASVIAEVERLRKAMELARKTHANEKAAWKAERDEWAELLRVERGLTCACTEGTPVPWEHRAAEVETEQPKEKR